jgi:dGTPase
MSRFTPEAFWEGRFHAEKPRGQDSRSTYDKDRSRLIHSPSFRRLQAKTQVLDITEGEYHRTRLTHSMEVAQIAQGLVQQLRQDYVGQEIVDALPPTELMETVAFAHDLGHPPFGHNGEVALNYKMQWHPYQELGPVLNGFEGNGQSLRILTKLERRPSGPGLNLTRRMLLGILKYPRAYSEVSRTKTQPFPVQSLAFVRQSDWQPPKCYLDTETDVVNWILDPLTESDRTEFIRLKVEPDANKHGKTRYKSLDCSILDLADDIAYATHDLEDGVELGLIQRDEWENVWRTTDPAWRKGNVQENLSDLLFGEGWERREAVGSLIHAFIVCARLETRDVFQSPVIDCHVSVEGTTRHVLDALKELTYTNIIRSSAVQTLEYRGRTMIMKLYDALVAEPESLLTEHHRKRYAECHGDPVQECRVICDFLAGMTDPYATRFYERLYVPRAGSTFDRL